MRTKKCVSTTREKYWRKTTVLSYISLCGYVKHRRSGNHYIYASLVLVSDKGYTIREYYACCMGNVGVEGCKVAKVKEAIDVPVYVP